MIDLTIPAITPEQIAELRALLAKATWRTNTRPACPKSSDDMRLVSAAVNALPALLDLAQSVLSAQAETGMESAQTNAARDVLAERQRQISEEGWTAEHDDRHTKGEMARAAANYATCSTIPAGDQFERHHLSRSLLAWPWDRQWWKPTTARRDLVKAGALILAEIERLDRAARRTPAKGGE